MSHLTLHQRMLETLQSVRSGRISARDAAGSLSANGLALEGLPYAMLKELDDLVMDLKLAAWDEGDDGFPDRARTLSNFDA